MATKKSNKQLWILLALIGIIAALILLLPGCGNRTKKNADQEIEATTLVKAGDTAPDFTAEMLDGEKITLSSLRGKVVMATAGYEAEEFDALTATIERTLATEQ